MAFEAEEPGTLVVGDGCIDDCASGKVAAKELDAARGLLPAKCSGLAANRASPSVPTTFISFELGIKGGGSGARRKEDWGLELNG